MPVDPFLDPNCQHAINQHTFDQHTLKDSFVCVGRGLHSGLKVIMTVMPAEENSGYRFIRKDVDSKFKEITALWHNVTDTRLSVTIANKHGIRVSTVEHLLAALQSCGVDNAVIVLDGPEVPILDGSARPFVDLIRSVGLVKLDDPRMAIRVKKRVRLQDGEKEIELVPSPQSWINMSICFPSSVIGQQALHIDISQHSFTEDVADARAFGFQEEAKTLHKLGLARGGSVHNLVVVDHHSVLNQEGLRYSDEFVRHKILDCIGDFTLAGARVVAGVNAKCCGHSLNNQLLHKLMDDETAYELVKLRDVAGKKQVSATSHANKPNDARAVEGNSGGYLQSFRRHGGKHSRAEKTVSKINSRGK